MHSKFESSRNVTLPDSVVSGGFFLKTAERPTKWNTSGFTRAVDVR